MSHVAGEHQLGIVRLSSPPTPYGGAAGAGDEARDLMSDVQVGMVL